MDLFEELDREVIRAKSEARRAGKSLPSKDSIVQDALRAYLDVLSAGGTAWSSDSPVASALNSGLGSLSDQEIDLCRAVLEINRISPEKSEHIFTIAEHLKGLIEVDAALAEYEEAESQEKTA